MEFSEMTENPWMLVGGSFLTFLVVLFKTCRMLGIEDMDSPYFYMAMLSGLPYLLFCGMSFFARSEQKRKYSYLFLFCLLCMNFFDWYGPKGGSTMEAVKSAIWFIQVMLIVPYAMIVFGGIEET